MIVFDKERIQMSHDQYELLKLVRNGEHGCRARLFNAWRVFSLWQYSQQWAIMINQIIESYHRYTTLHPLMYTIFSTVDHCYDAGAVSNSYDGKATSSYLRVFFGHLGFGEKDGVNVTFVFIRRKARKVSHGDGGLSQRRFYLSSLGKEVRIELEEVLMEILSDLSYNPSLCRGVIEVGSLPPPINQADGKANEAWKQETEDILFEDQT